jgi:hypothetical protein
MIRTRESALCKLREKYRAKKLEEVCQLENNPLIQSVSSSLNLDTSGFLASVVRSSKHEPKGKRWSFKEKVFDCLYPKVLPQVLCISPVPISPTF